jgi:hypothetical protein
MPQMAAVARRVVISGRTMRQPPGKVKARKQRARHAI